MSLILGLILFWIGSMMFLNAIDNMKRESHQFNTPWRWLLLFAGMILAGFGVVLVSLEAAR